MSWVSSSIVRVFPPKTLGELISDATLFHQGESCEDTGNCPVRTDGGAPLVRGFLLTDQEGAQSLASSRAFSRSQSGSLSSSGSS